MPTIRMSPATRLFLAGNTVSMLGTGLVIAFILIYLHQVRGVALPVVGGLLTASAGAGLLVVPLVGILLDRIGARRVLTGIVARPPLRSCWRGRTTRLRRCRSCCYTARPGRRCSRQYGP